MKIETKFDVDDIVAVWQRDNNIKFIRIKKIEYQEDNNGTCLIYYSTGNVGYNSREVYSLCDLDLIKSNIVRKMDKGE